jgi:predicted PilT family ATPase
VELGQVPSTVDTVIHIEDGKVAKVSAMSLKVKLPTGMGGTQRDLARPVVEVREFERGVLEYEMFTFGGEKVVVPVRGGMAPTVGRRDRRPKGRGVPGESVPISISYNKKKVTIFSGRKYAKQRIEIFADELYLFTTVVGRNGESAIRIKTRQGSTLVDAMEEGAKVTAKIAQ